MTPSQKTLKGSKQCQDDCTGENFVRKRAVSQIDQKQWGTKRDLDRLYINSVLQAQTALGQQESIIYIRLLLDLFFNAFFTVLKVFIYKYQ